MLILLIWFSKLQVVRSDIEIDGDRGPVVYEPLIMIRDYRISWDKDSEISAELARLRWKKKWTVQKIADHMGLSYDSANMRLKRLSKLRATYT